MRSFQLLIVVLLCAAFAVGTSSRAAAQQLRWDGTSPYCNGQCRSDETEITRAATPPGGGGPPGYYGPLFGAACALGTKALCQKTPGYACRWDGTAPFCSGHCRGGEVRSNPPPGSSSGRSCATGHKVYCCRRT